ncbi:hypothetical protein BRD02_04995 [Halobacteriales archaeon QS_8_69_73]|nr:MAG: hypothetical protein BRD02_04995 [Halobacteriales archaeon QS_8_69_73]
MVLGSTVRDFSVQVLYGVIRSACACLDVETSKAPAALGMPRLAVLLAPLRCLHRRGTAERRSPFQSARIRLSGRLSLAD